MWRKNYLKPSSLLIFIGKINLNVAFATRIDFLKKLFIDHP
jgi:hypothetical protein